MSSDPPKSNGSSGPRGRETAASSVEPLGAERLAEVGSEHRPDGRPGGDPAPGPENPLRYAGAGLEFAFTIALFVLAGWWLDRRWDSSPWMLLAGLATGFTAGLYRLIRIGRGLQGPRR